MISMMMLLNYDDGDSRLLDPLRSKMVLHEEGGSVRGAVRNGATTYSIQI